MKFTADKPGTYLGQCAEYCGLSHANMRFRVIVQTPSDYEEWLAGQRDGPAVTLAEAGDGRDAVHDRSSSAPTATRPRTRASSTYGPNLTHLASRTTFASGYYALTRART